MRGGTANVTVILSDDRISSPIINHFDTAIILNQQSLDKFESMVKPGGTIIFDPNGIIHEPSRKDVKVYKIEGTRLASEMKQPKTFNMIILGAFLKVKPIMDVEHVKLGLEKSLPERHHKLIPMNIDALMVGEKNVEEVH